MVTKELSIMNDAVRHGMSAFVARVTEYTVSARYKQSRPGPDVTSWGPKGARASRVQAKAYHATPNMPMMTKTLYK